MSAISDVLLWAMRVNAKKNAQPHQILEIAATCGLDDAQAAFHKIARMAHPDLHRTTLSEADLESVTTAYARAAAAYQEFRTQRIRGGVAAGTPPTPSGGLPPVGSPAHQAAANAPAGAGSMSSKALVYYRKAELALRRGDLRGAILQIKMAIAADPQSAFLRTALAEVEAEVQK